MQNKTSGILIYKKKIKENDLFVKFLSKDDQIITGIVYGGNSSKKNIYQIGYYLNLRLYRKNLNKPYAIDSEIKKPYMGVIFEDKYKLQCLLSIIAIINLSIIEGQNVKGIFNITDKFILKLVYNRNWIHDYCKWLFNLLKVIGYEIDYHSYSNKQYFDIDLIQFTNVKKNNTYLFPHEFLSKKERIQYNYMKIIFIIFENIFTKNHLNSLNKLPYNYINFKDLIMRFLKNNHVSNN